MITSVDTGTKDVIANDFKINLRTETNNTISDYKYYWGFSDVVVIQRRCETCVSKEVILLMSQVGGNVLYCWRGSLLSCYGVVLDDLY